MLTTAYLILYTKNMCNRLDKEHIQIMMDRIKTAVEQGVADSSVNVTDPMGNGHHFEVHVTSGGFAGLPLVKQHRLVLDTLKNLLAEDLHSVVIKTKIN